MQFTTVIALLTAAAGSSMAAPAQADTVSMMAAGSSWTMQNFLRQCANGTCKYSYSINTNDGSKATPCSYQVNGNPASQASYQNVKCGAFTIGSTWSGQFGPGNGFQTLSVVKGNQIIYPGYNDKDLSTGKVVKPDRSYTPQNLP